MSKIIYVKEELQALLHDLNLGVESGYDSESLVKMSQKKLESLLVLSKKGYFSMRWER